MTDFTVGATATSFIDSTVVTGPTYYYQVQAENQLSGSAWVGPFSTAPRAPSGLSGTISRGRRDRAPPPPSLRPPRALGPRRGRGRRLRHPPGPSVTLTWTNNDATPPATQVEIQRAIKADFSDEITLSYTGPAPATYTDSTVAAGTTYFYRVRADDPLSESHWSNSFETDPPAPTGLTDTIAAGPPLSVTLTWTNPEPPPPPRRCC